MSDEVEKALATAVVASAAAAIALVGWAAKEQRISPRAVRALAAGCGLGLLVMLVTDWPYGNPDKGFWDNNGLVAGVLSTVLLISVGFLAYEDGELRAQQRLDASLTAAGVGGIVDHLVDVDVALGLVCREHGPERWGWTGFSDAGRPLRWIRRHPDRLVRRDDRSDAGDPRTWAAVLPPVEDPAWRLKLVDQCIRRLLSGIRDWSPVISTSRNGVRVLIAIAELRKDLMELTGLLQRDSDAALPLLISLRQRVRLLSAFLEELSGAEPPRAQILSTFDPVHPGDREIEWAADHRGRDLFGAEWRTVLKQTERRLRESSVS